MRLPTVVRGKHYRWKPRPLHTKQARSVALPPPPPKKKTQPRLESLFNLSHRISPGSSGSSVIRRFTVLYALINPFVLCQTHPVCFTLTYDFVCYWATSPAHMGVESGGTGGPPPPGREISGDIPPAQRIFQSPRFHGHLKAAQWCDQAYAAHRTTRNPRSRRL